MDIVGRVGDTTTEILSAEVAEELAARFVGGLASRAIPPMSHLVFQASNSALLLSAIYGALRAGFAPVVISDKLTERERAELIADVEPAGIFQSRDLPDLFDASPAQLDYRMHCRPMHFTSGTSGRPKGVWSGWLDAESAKSLVTEEWSAWGISSTDRYLAVAPMSHSAPLRFPLMTLLAGGSVVIPRGFDPETISELIAGDEVNTAFLAPAHLQRLLENCPPKQSRMRLVAHAGSACPEHVRSGSRELFGDDALREFYGSTEGQFTICTPQEYDAHPGTVGVARPGRALRIGPDGRIWCRVPQYARFEYWRDPTKTADTWDGDWFTVGDLGHLDDAGYLYLDGRRSDLIITGGVNVYPAEIERVVLDIPGVRQASAFPMPDDHWGQRVCLVVVGDVDEETIASHCETQLAPYKRPKSIYRALELPHTHSGKVDRLRIPQSLGLVR